MFYMYLFGVAHVAVVWWRSLFGLKRFLIEWGWQSFEVRVDTGQGALKIGKCEVVKIKAIDLTIELTFSDDWELRLRDDKLTRLTRDCQYQIAKNRIGNGTGRDT